MRYAPGFMFNCVCETKETEMDMNLVVIFMQENDHPCHRLNGEFSGAFPNIEDALVEIKEGIEEYHEENPDNLVDCFFVLNTNTGIAKKFDVGIKTAVNITETYI